MREALRGGLCALTCAALAVRLCPEGASAATAAALLPYGAVWALAVGALWLGYGAWLKREKPFSAALYWALAALFSLIVTLGPSYAAVGNASLATGQPVRALLFFAGRVPLYYAGMLLLRDRLTVPAPVGSLRETAGGQPVGGSLQNTAEAQPVCASPLPTAPARSFLYAAGMLLCWLPYLFFLFPGTVSNDSVTQIMEIIGVEPLTNANPVFQTALVYLFRGAGKVLGSADAGVALYCGAQALLMAWLLGALLAEMRRSAAPRWLCRLSFAFYALCPIFPLFAFCMGKDTNFAMAVCWLSLLTLQALRRPEAQSRRRTLCLCLTAVLCALLRNPGVYLAMLTLLWLLGWALARRKVHPGCWRAPAAALVAVAAVSAALRLLLLPALSIPPTPETENWSLPLQQTARVAATHPLAPEEAAAIDGVLALDRLKADYNGELSDPVKFLWRNDATEAQKAAFFRTWRALLRKYPATCLSATFHNSYGYLYPGYLSTLKPTLLIGRQKRSTPQVEAAFPYTVNPRAEALKAFTNRLAQNPLYRVLVSPGLYGWLTLFGCVTLLSRKPRRFGIAAFPALFSLAGCLMSAVNGYFRYSMPLYLCAPLLLWLCALTSPALPKRKIQGRKP